MELHIWWAFFIGTALICATPGPNMLHVLSYSVRYGFKESINTMAGCLAAVSLIIIIAVTGVGALLMASPQIFDVLRYLGAAYLIYVGINSCLSSGGMIKTELNEIAKTQSKKEAFNKGFLIGISNPKAILFAMAYFPQFINVNQPAIPQFTVLFVTFVILECACYLIYALGGKAITRIITNKLYGKIVNVTIGLLFVSFGVMLLLYKL
jgi:threonine/homoserine/homoserine lactone efflux protein